MRTLGYAVLGLLAVKPRTGYEIAKFMKAPIGYMWTASHSRIYPELQILEASGLVRHQVIDGPGPRDNKIYTITTKGRTTLARWVDSPLTPQPARSELMLRVRALWTISPDRAIRFIDGVRLDSEQRLAIYLDNERQLAAAGDERLDPRTPAFGSYASLQAGIGHERHLIEWCTWLIAQLRQPHHVTIEE
jgi:DNA-binding PadR family transcriptional regulator